MLPAELGNTPCQHIACPEGGCADLQCPCPEILHICDPVRQVILGSLDLPGGGNVCFSGSGQTDGGGAPVKNLRAKLSFDVNDVFAQ